jgi:acetylornithine deacetylase/succinyl-diaminopimelate desuccinylase-like protein
MTLEAVLSKIDDSLPQALERLMALLRIPSISTDPAFKPDCARAADWLVEDLKSLGFDASARPTPGHPMVVAHGGTGGPHLLFYGHYDVQPVDPLDQWETPPFAPVIVTLPDGRKAIRARGSSDDKGQIMTFIEACRAWKSVAGSLPIGITFLIEGEEEEYLMDQEGNIYDLRGNFIGTTDDDGNAAGANAAIDAGLGSAGAGVSEQQMVEDEDIDFEEY